MATATKLEPINGDTRFYPGYAWASEQVDCKRGLCLKGTTRDEAVESYMAPLRARYWLKGKEVTFYVMMSADDPPTKHCIKI